MNDLVKKLFSIATIGTALILGKPDKAFAPNLDETLRDNFDVNYRRIIFNHKPETKILHPRFLSYAGEKDTLYVPEYPLNESGVPSTYCARYVKKMSKDVFDLNYPSNPAWKIREGSKIVKTSAKGFAPWEIDSLIKINEIQPGMIFGIYNPKSDYNKKNRLYTHVGSYLSNLNDVPMIAHQFGSRTRVDSLDWFYNRNMKIIEILDVKKEK